jgi:hypothetical protein
MRRLTQRHPRLRLAWRQWRRCPRRDRRNVKRRAAGIVGRRRAVHVAPAVASKFPQFNNVLADRNRCISNIVSPKFSDAVHHCFARRRSTCLMKIRCFRSPIRVLRSVAQSAFW